MIGGLVAHNNVFMRGFLVFLILFLPVLSPAKLLVKVSGQHFDQTQTLGGKFLKNLGILILDDTAQNRRMFLNRSLQPEGIFDLPQTENPNLDSYVGWTGGFNNWGQQAINVSEAWRYSLGKNVKILILDSGVDKNHPVLSGKIASIKSFVTEANLPYQGFDQIGHGTHIAGLVAGDDGIGVAPQAQLFVAKVCDNHECPESKIYEALEWGIQNQVDVINVSLGRFVTNAIEKSAIEKLISLGITVVAAAGNQGASQVTYPARYPNVISVGASTGQSQVAEFSNRGDQVDLLAPGVGIFSSFPLNLGNVFEVFAHGKNEIFQIRFARIIGVSKPDLNLKGQLIDVHRGEITDYKGVAPEGKIVLIQSDVDGALRKIKIAMAFGFKGFLLELDSGIGPINTGFGSDPLAISGVVISQQTAQKLRDSGSAWSIEFNHKASGVQELSGTSMSAAFVTGVVGLIKSIYPDLKPGQIEQILKRSLVNGVLNAKKALEMAEQTNQHQKNLL